MRRYGPSPHAWGLRTVEERDMRLAYGPSPHAWGLRGARTSASPASRGPSPHAWGLRPEGPTRPKGYPVHPHTRGDYSSSSKMKRRAGGPSPHAWGLLLRVLWVSSVSRSIPTRVGTTYRCCQSWQYHLRSIPTRVGTTVDVQPNQERPSVHPHTRGDYAWFMMLATAVSGPSPHAWGLRHRPRRVTPAYLVHPHTRGDYT